MRKIVFANSKGGSGKTTLAICVAAFLEMQGVRVSFVDLDPQQSAATLRNVVALESLQGIAPASAPQLAVIDTPPYRSATLPHVFAAADLVIIPLQPTPIDAAAVRAIVNECSAAGVRFALVLNRVKPGATLTALVRESLESQGLPVMRCEIHDRIAYQRATVSGRIEDKALAEIAGLTGEILRIIASV